MKNIRVFVCYTKRDGSVSNILLEKLSNNLQEICFPFIHDIDNEIYKFQQFSVLKFLFKSHILLLIESPYVYKSPWVKIELLISKIKMQPIITISATELKRVLLYG